MSKIYLEEQRNKVSSWSASPSNTNYTSEALVKGEVDAINRTNAIQQRQIDNLNEALGETTVIDYPDTTYQKGTVPSDVCKFAQINNIIGVTEKTKNKLIYPYVSNDGNATPTTTSKTLNGLTFYVDSNGYVNVSGTATSQVDLKLYGTWGSTSYNLLNGQTGTVVKGCEGTVTGLTSIYVVKNGSTVASSSIATDSITLSSGDYISCVMVRIANGSTVDAKFRVWVELGSSSTGYTPYFSGLKSATITKVMSVGKNLFNVDSTDKEVGYAWLSTGTKTANGNAKIYNIKVTPSTAYSFSGMNNLGTGSMCVAWLDANKNFISSAFLRNFASKDNQTSPSNAEYIGYTCTNAESLSLTQIEKGSTATTFSPYGTDELALPETVTVRSAGTVHDTYTPITGVIDRPTIEYDLGNLNWNFTNSIFVSDELFDIKPPTTSAEVGNIVCGKYTTVAGGNIEDKQIALSGGRKFWVKDSAYSDATVFKTAMNGVKVIGERATPTTESVTPINPFIQCEAGGQISLNHTESPATASKFQVEYANKQ